MESSDDRINAWLEDLEPDEPLAVAQDPYEPARRRHPMLMGVLAVVGVLVIGIGAMKTFGGSTGATDVPGEGATDTVAVSSSPPDQSTQAEGAGGGVAEGQVSSNAPTGSEDTEATSNPDGMSALGIGSGTPEDGANEPDPHNQTDPAQTDLTQQLVRAGNQWITHAGAEEAVRVALTKDQRGAISNQAVQVYAVQSLPLAKVGRIVQVRALVDGGTQSLWAVPVKDDGTVLAQPWLVSSEQHPLIEAVPDPEGVVDKEEAVAVLTQAGWTHVEVVASGVHPAIPGILIVRATGIPPHGKQPVTSVLWLGGPTGSRHVMGI